MPLTPEEVISKTFQPTRFAEGYNQDEVDDFLDEVVSTLRTLQQENDELRAKLSSCESRVAELSSSSGSSVSSAVIAPDPIPLAKQLAPMPAEQISLGSAPTADPNAAAGMLALAQRLHDEHVQNGQQKHDAMIAEAKARADRLVHDAEQTRSETLNHLEVERDQLETTITTLRGFEHEYRSRLRSFLQAQISDLDNQPALEPEPTGA